MVACWRRRDRGRRRPAGDRGDPRGAWLGHPAHPRCRRRDGRGPPIRERHARTTVRRRGGRGRGPRTGGRHVVARRRPATRRPGCGSAPARVTREPGRRRSDPPARVPPRPLRARSHAGRAAIVALVVALVVAGGVVAARPAGVARVSILDVGQGDAILVEGSRGGRLLVDGGPDPDRLLVVLDERIPPWDRRIDAVILTHPHEDHVAGLALLLARYHVGRVFEPGMIGPGPGYAAWRRTFSVAGSADARSLAAGDRLIGRRDRAARPVADRRPGPGDATRRRDRHQQRLDRPARPGRGATIPADGRRRAGHRPVAPRGAACHTSTCSRSPTTAARPRRRRRSSIPCARQVAVASAGTGNPYGHPAESTLEPTRRGRGARPTGPTSTGRSSSGSRRADMTVRAEGGRPRAARALAPARPAGRAGTIPARAADCHDRGIPVRASRSTALVPPPTVQARRPGPPRSSLTVGYHRER